MDYFNLSDGQSAIVRLLYSSIDKLEIGKRHRIVSEGKNRIVKCLGNNCPLCAADNVAEERLYLHLWDYTDNKEKVWNRTTNSKFMDALKDVDSDWGIGNAVIRITRDGADFPKYDIKTVNPQQYEEIDKNLYDTDCGYMCSPYRSADELTQYIETGILPPHTKKESATAWVSKEEWIKQQKEKEAATQQKATTATTVNVEAAPDVNDDDDPFMDPFINLKKV